MFLGLALSCFKHSERFGKFRDGSGSQKFREAKVLHVILLLPETFYRKAALTIRENAASFGDLKFMFGLCTNQSGKSAN